MSRLFLILATVIATGSNAQAQNGIPEGGNFNQVGDALGGNSGGLNTGSGSNASGNTGSSGAGTSVGLDETSAFSGTQRSSSKFGSTEATGAGFSQSSVATPGGGPAVTPGGIGGGMGGFGGVGGFGNMFDNMTGGSSQSTQPIIRTRIRSAINLAPASPQRIGATANVRFQTISPRPGLRSVNVQMQGRTAIIQGTVASESDRRMSQLLMSLEPGVSRIDNRIRVAP